MLDLSQAELAEAVGVSRQTINAIETGRSEPSLRWLNAMEFRGERDRATWRDGLAAVGAVALILSLIG
jgi:transcriptional regulator with XRE-family HTH domain